MLRIKRYNIKRYKPLLALKRGRVRCSETQGGAQSSILTGIDEDARVDSPPSLEGTRWDVVWEAMEDHSRPASAGGRHSRVQEYPPLSIIFTENGFRTGSGYEGCWTWAQEPNGELVIHIADDHPDGRGWYRNAVQAEILVYFDEMEGRRSPERMRLIKRGDS